MKKEKIVYAIFINSLSVVLFLTSCSQSSLKIETFKPIGIIEENYSILVKEKIPIPDSYSAGSTLALFSFLIKPLIDIDSSEQDIFKMNAPELINYLGNGKWSTDKYKVSQLSDYERLFLYEQRYNKLYINKILLPGLEKMKTESKNKDIQFIAEILLLAYLQPTNSSNKTKAIIQEFIRLNPERKKNEMFQSFCNSCVGAERVQGL